MIKVSIFPDQFPHACYPQSTMIRLYGSFSSEALQQSINEERHSLELVDVPPDDGVEYFLALGGFTIHKPFKESDNSNNSDALYLAECDGEKDKWLLQYLPPNSMTSCHHHDGNIKEIFYSIAGKAMLRVPEKDLLLFGNGETHIVEPEITHEIHTGPRSALTLIHISGDFGQHFVHHKDPRIDRELKW